MSLFDELSNDLLPPSSEEGSLFEELKDDRPEQKGEWFDAESARRDYEQRLSPEPSSVESDENKPLTFTGQMRRNIGISLAETAGAIGTGLSEVGATDFGNWLDDVSLEKIEQWNRELNPEGLSIEELAAQRREDHGFARRAFTRGYNTYIPGTGGGLLAWAGSALDNEAMRDRGMEIYKGAMDRAAANPANIESVREAFQSPSNFGTWVAENIIMLFPQQAAMGVAAGVVTLGGKKVLATGAGAYAGKKVLDRFVKKRTDEMVKKGMGRKAAEKLAKETVERQALTRLGAGLSISGMYTGSSYAEVLDLYDVDNPVSAPIAGATAAIATVLIGGQVAAIERILGGSQARAFANAVRTGNRNVVGRILKEFSHVAPKAAVEEFFQESSAFINAIWNNPEVEREASAMINEYIAGIERPLESAATIGFASGTSGAITRATVQGKLDKETQAVYDREDADNIARAYELHAKVGQDSFSAKDKKEFNTILKVYPALRGQIVDQTRREADRRASEFQQQERARQALEQQETIEQQVEAEALSQGAEPIEAAIAGKEAANAATEQVVDSLIERQVVENQQEIQAKEQEELITEIESSQEEVNKLVAMDTEKLQSLKTNLQGVAKGLAQSAETNNQARIKLKEISNRIATIDAVIVDRQSSSSEVDAADLLTDTDAPVSSPEAPEATTTAPPIVTPTQKKKTAEKGSGKKTELTREQLEEDAGLPMEPTEQTEEAPFDIETLGPLEAEEASPSSDISIEVERKGTGAPTSKTIGNKTVKGRTVTVSQGDQSTDYVAVKEGRQFSIYSLDGTKVTSGRTQTEAIESLKGIVQAPRGLSQPQTGADPALTIPEESKGSDQAAADEALPWEDAPDPEAATEPREEFTSEELKDIVVNVEQEVDGQIERKEQGAYTALAQANKDITLFEQLKICIGA